jgi:hypothetical protein
MSNAVNTPNAAETNNVNDRPVAHTDCMKCSLAYGVNLPARMETASPGTVSEEPLRARANTNGAHASSICGYAGRHIAS